MGREKHECKLLIGGMNRGYSIFSTRKEGWTPPCFSTEKEMRSLKFQYEYCGRKISWRVDWSELRLSAKSCPLYGVMRTTGITLHLLSAPFRCKSFSRNIKKRFVKVFCSDRLANSKLVVRKRSATFKEQKEAKQPLRNTLNIRHIYFFLN